MNIHVHVSYPENLGNRDSERVWMIPSSFRQRCIKILGGNIDDPSSITLRKGYFTQSQNTVEIHSFLENIGRKYREIPSGIAINYELALQDGYEFLFQKINGGWTFNNLFEIVSQGYTDEEVDTHGSIKSIGEMRKFALKQSDGGVRYLLQYDDAGNQKRDIENVEKMKLSEEENKSKYNSLDTLYELIF